MSPRVARSPSMRSSHYEVLHPHSEIDLADLGDRTRTPHNGDASFRMFENSPQDQGHHYFPLVDDSIKDSLPAIQPRLYGWRGGVLVSMGATGTVLVINVIFLICAASTWPRENGIMTAYTGDCSYTKNNARVVHLFINVLSSVLLGASNYCMQRLASPTREEVDKAHARKKWLDIGVPSFRNLFAISKIRVLLWVLLVLSSLPLHFLYNAVVFETLAANDVVAGVVLEGFLDLTSWNESSSLTENKYNLHQIVSDGKYRNSSLFTNLTATECWTRYDKPFISDAGHVFAIVEPDSAFLKNQTDDYIEVYSPAQYVHLARPDSQAANPVTAKYCLSQVVQQKCQLQFSFDLLIVVIACNIAKVIIMALVFRSADVEPLVTLGDAIASFLRRPDATTENRCLMSNENVDKLWKYAPRPQKMKCQTRNRWAGAVSRRRWIASSALYFAAIIVSSILLAYGGVEDKGHNGLGTLDVKFLLDVSLPFAKSIIPYAMLANLPQVVISVVYLTYNSLYTCMLSGREWSQYAIKRAPLRVTFPKGEQRSTYFLSLPWSWSIPLLVLSAFLHWIISQSIFLVRIATYRGDELVSSLDTQNIREIYQHLKQDDLIFTGIGWSDVAIYVSLGLGSLLILTCYALAVIMPYPKGTLRGATCSAVISAACHPSVGTSVPHDPAMASMPLMWGVVVPGNLSGQVGHISFSDGDVQTPRDSVLYAGKED